MAVDLETDGKNDDLQDKSANVKNVIDPHRALRATGRNDVWSGEELTRRAKRQ